ncbi:Por secretion system C-terminal sorting domain-containing protein [Nonlabens sp. Hel1_33_55]|uniref:T9SS type A sorting domain-containing protein n=1 Tax=Nonlabens sp. Hel1_33_55 TaxID=1336802 RepID=UPI000875C8A5|nr:T9SS type A sorting domain-containing protein [Nonlabens sp. Hel1_33_55]SCY06448.1 Por secretion system C-terminal sorting domain-containing protein [Nonlabens sp. Hel1_33_55]
MNYNSNGTVSDIIGEEFQNDTWVSDYRDSFTYNGDGQLTRKIFETWNGSSYELDEEFDYTYDNNGNLIVEVSDFNFSTAGPEGRETYVYDTSELMSNIANPFVDKTGLEYVFDDFPYVNKILEERYESYDSNSSSFNEVSSKRVYNYNSTLSIEEAAAPLAKVNVYPNPTSGILNIETSNFEIAKVSVYGLFGNQILTTSKQMVDLESFTSGVYFLELTDVSGQSSKHKIIKK